MKIRSWVVFLNKNLLFILNSPWRKTIFSLLALEIEILQHRRERLYLGKVGFEFKPFMYNGINVCTLVEMTFTRQDMTRYEPYKLENLLQRFTWKTDTAHIIPLIILLYFMFRYFWKKFKAHVISELPTFFYRYEHYDAIIRIGFETTIYQCPIGSLKKWHYINLSMVDVLVDFCAYFDILF